jgi:hypothetical protein
VYQAERGFLSMKTATGTTLIRNGRLIDGAGAAPVADAALIPAKLPDQ